MKKLIYILLLCMTLSSCAKSLQPTTIEQEMQKQIEKKVRNKILKCYILVAGFIFLVVIYDPNERFDL
jgi:hypothetical protein